MPRRSDSTRPALRSCVRWWLTVDSVRPSAAARSPPFSSLAVDPNRNDMILTRAGSASALSLSATSRAASSVIGPAATGAQQTGAEMSIMGSVLGTKAILPEILTYIKKVACWALTRQFDICPTGLPEVIMSRVQLALNVDDLDKAITFYSKLFNTAPAKVKNRY